VGVASYGGHVCCTCFVINVRGARRGKQLSRRSRWPQKIVSGSQFALGRTGYTKSIFSAPGSRIGVHRVMDHPPHAPQPVLWGNQHAVCALAQRHSKIMAYHHPCLRQGACANLGARIILAFLSGTACSRLQACTCLPGLPPRLDRPGGARVAMQALRPICTSLRLPEPCARLAEPRAMEPRPDR